METGTLLATSDVPFHFGTLYQSFSVNQSHVSGWFYGDHSTFGRVTPYPGSNADVANVGDLVLGNLETIDLSQYNFHDDFVAASEGNTVIFKGNDGSIGAWVLDDFTSCSPAPCSQLSGTWYYSPVPEPSSLLLVLMGLAWLRRKKR